MTSPSDPLEAGLLLGESLDQAGIPYAIGGALAYGIWGIPRATIDVDINIFVEPEDLDPVLDVLTELGIAVDRKSAHVKAETDGMFVARWGLFRIDLFTPSIDFSWEAFHSRSAHEIEGRRAWFLSAEAIAVFKLLFFRGKDIVDLERLLAVQGPALDVAYIREKLVEMMGKDDERVIKWDRLVAAANV